MPSELVSNACRILSRNSTHLVFCEGSTNERKLFITERTLIVIPPIALWLIRLLNTTPHSSNIVSAPKPPIAQFPFLPLEGPHSGRKEKVYFAFSHDLMISILIRPTWPVPFIENRAVIGRIRSKGLRTPRPCARPPHAANPCARARVGRAHPRRLARHCAESDGRVVAGGGYLE